MRKIFPALLILLARAALPLEAAGDGHGEIQELKRFEDVRPFMGSTFQVVLYASDELAANKAVEAAFARVAELNQIFSDYESDSETNRLSRSAPMPTPVAVSPDLWQVLWQSQQLNRASNGGFDVTVGPLSRLWRRARRREELPSQKRLKEALAAVGFEHLRLDPQTRTVQLLAPGMRLDFGGIAKGYAADAALAELRALGGCRALVNAGGDVALGDPPPGQSGWRVGIAPLEADRAPSRFVRLANCGIATSGDMWQFVEIEGKRYSHLVDPRTGLGLTFRSSVTVISKNCMLADGMASTVSVLGPAAGETLVNKTCCTECLIVWQDGETIRRWQSRGFDAYLERAKANEER